MTPTARQSTDVWPANTPDIEAIGYADPDQGSLSDEYTVDAEEA